MSDDASKHLKALIIAGASAPYLTSLFMGIPLLITYGLKGIGDALEFVVATLIMGTAGLVIYGIPIAIAAGGLGGILIWMGFRNRMSAIAFGATLGASFGLTLLLRAGSERTGNDFWPTVISMTLSGAVCGWIYWRIAFGGRSAPGST